MVLQRQAFGVHDGVRGNLKGQMPTALTVLSVLGAAFFGVKMLTDPIGWLAYALGIAGCLFVWTRNTNVRHANHKVSSMNALHDIDDRPTLDRALASDRAILYKHSTRCPVSSYVIDEVHQFADTHPDWSIYILKVVERRALSNAVADELGITHQSPQAFVIKQGTCVWHASHSDITAERLDAQAT
ncbi:MAG TPA: bacillithiol system redox-active protein YtxJ [Acidobacteria bacterium]|nr:bacillithiol system redox-active protein YtxJ [Acidobacteriota bacterium]